MGDGLDNDCDGLTDILRRPYMRGWWSPPGPAVLDWTLSGGASQRFDAVNLIPGSTASWDVSSAAPFTWDNGLLVVTVALKNTGVPFNDCNLTVDSDLAPSGPVSVALDTVGSDGGVTVAVFDDLDLGPRPIDITRLDIDCLTTTLVDEQLDWITLSNGEYGAGTGWAPGTDQEFAFSDTWLPFGGQKTTVVTGVDLSQAGNPTGLIAGSDNGGVAYTDAGSSDPYTWVTFNGDGDQLIDNADYAVWGLWAETLDNVYMLSGDNRASAGEQAAVRGRLRRTTDRGVTWTELTPYHYDSSLPVHLGAHGALNPWDSGTSGGGERADAGGDLILKWSTVPSNPELLVANHFYVPGATTDFSGVHEVDADTGTVCSASPFTGLPKRSDAGDTDSDGLISSLAIATVREGTEIDPFFRRLFVGYKLRPSNKDALFICELPASQATPTCGSTLPCAAVPNTGFDIRDLVVVDDVVFIADAGRRWALDADTGGTGLYTVEDSVEPQVHAFDGDGWALWVLDDTTATAPTSWDLPDTVTGYNTLAEDVWPTGNLLPPLAERGDLAGLVVSPVTGDDERHLFALFGTGRAQTAYEIPKVYRAQIADAAYPDVHDFIHTGPCGSATGDAECPLEWTPLKDLSGALHPTTGVADSWATNEAEREAAVSLQPTENWHVGDQEVRYGWYPSGIIDGLFLEHQDSTVDLVAAGSVGMYALGPEDLTAGDVHPGWETAYWDPTTKTLSQDELDLDNLRWTFANADSSDFQQTVTNAIAWCSDCDSSNHPVDLAVNTEGLGVVGLGDLSAGTIWGPDSAGARPRGVVDCHFDVLRAPSRAVDMWWEDLDLDGQADAGTEVIWLGMAGQGTETYDRGGLLRSEDGGETYCWEMTSTRKTVLQGQIPAKIQADTSGVDTLVCKAGSLTSHPHGLAHWVPCDGDATVDGTMFSNTSVDLGDVSAIATVDFSLAFATAWDKEGTNTSTRGGLVALEGSSGSLAPFTTDNVLVDSDTVNGTGTGEVQAGSCSLTWADLWSRFAFMTLSPDLPDPDCLTDACRLVVGFQGTGATETDCGLFVVDAQVDSAGAWSSTWRSLTLDDGSGPPGCDIDANVVKDAVIPPWDPDSVFVVGNSHGTDKGGMCQYDLDSATFTEQIVAANRHRAVLSSVVAHPHIDGLLYVGSYLTYTDANTDTPGILAVARRDAPDGSHRWLTAQVAVRGLAKASALDLAWGWVFDPAAAVDPYTNRLYVATGGSGPQAGTVCDQIAGCP